MHFCSYVLRLVSSISGYEVSTSHSMLAWANTRLNDFRRDLNLQL